MSKPGDLEAAMRSFNTAPAPVAVVKPEPVAKAGGLPPSRVGKKALITYHDPAISKQLKQLALDLDRESIQSLVEEALNDLFTKYRRPTIA